jgi:hypothetical protein
MSQEKTVTIRAFSIDLAKIVGEKPAMFIHQLDYWLNRPKMGYELEGQRFIKNTYKGWTSPENFPHWTPKTVQRVVKKLEEYDLLITTQLPKSYDRTLFYRPNYFSQTLLNCGYVYSPVIAVSDARKPKRANRSGQKRVDLSRQNGVNQSGQNVQNIKVHRLPQRELHRIPTEIKKQVGKQQDPTGGRATETRRYRVEYKTAEAWIRSQNKDFKKEVRKYLDCHCNKPTVSYPAALRMKIVVEIWRKYTGKYSITDFEYVDKQQFMHMECVDLTPEKVKQSSWEDEMQILYDKGECYDTKSSHQTIT